MMFERFIDLMFLFFCINVKIFRLKNELLVMLNWKWIIILVSENNSFFFY